MHEWGLIQSLMRKVAEEAAAHRATGVHRLTVRIGEAAGVEVELLRLAFETFRERTICADATLDVVPVPIVWACPTCGRQVPPGAVLRCAECGMPARLVQGDEIVLERIELEVADV